MPSHDYYVILGVSPTESAEGIRDAFRALAHRYHPDRAGPRSNNRFQRISEAYHVLSDAERRAAYDARRDHDGFARPRSTSVPIERPPPQHPRRHAPAEPLIPRGSKLLHPLQVAAPTRDWLFDRYVDSCRMLRRRQRLRPLRLNVTLCSEEAAQGGSLRLHMPVFDHCHACGGAGMRRSRGCMMCDGSGVREALKPLQLRIPPRVRDGTVLEIPSDQGFGESFLELRIRVV